jgi:hypothetical protein
MHGAGIPEKRKKREGDAVYTSQDIATLEAVRDYYRYPCGKLAAPVIREQRDFPASEPEFGVNDAMRAGLLKISPAAIDRKLREEKKRPSPRGISGTKPGSLIRRQAQVRTHYHIRPGLDGTGGLEHLVRTPVGVRIGRESASGTDASRRPARTESRVRHGRRVACGTHGGSRASGGTSALPAAARQKNR